MSTFFLFSRGPPHQKVDRNSLLIYSPVLKGLELQRQKVVGLKLKVKKVKDYFSSIEEPSKAVE